MMREKANTEFKILIVDDVPKNIQILGNILKKELYQISYALNGSEALEMVNTQSYDLILLDVMMPGMDGFEVCKILKTNSETSDIPIIFLTAKAEKENVIRGFKYGAEDYVTKPFSADELLARVKTHLSLKNKQEQLKSMNTILEEKVEKRTKQLQEANKQLIALAKAKSDFLSIISHELRTPLNGLLGLIELLEDTEKTQEQEEYIEYLKETSARLVKFSETAILITTLNAEKYKLSYSPQKVSYLIDNVIDRISGRLKEKRLKCNIKISPEDLMISIDFDLINNCMEMLLDNAVKYSPDEDSIEVNAKIENGNPLIEIIDNGPGFDKNIADKMFEYFTSADVLNSEGLGLSIAAVKLIMDAHNGHIQITSQDGGGAAVRLIFNGS